MKSIVFLFVAILAFEARCYTIQGQSGESQPSSAEQIKNSVNKTEEKHSVVITQEEYEANPEAYSEDILDNGIWMWLKNDSNLNFPMKAVYGGYSENETYFLMRADHQETNGHYAGKLLGYYSPIAKRAVLTYDGKSYEKEVFQILLHQRSAWSSKYDERELVQGSSGEYFCRFESDFTEYLTPGRVDEDMRLCTIPFGDGDMSSGGFETLKKACIGKNVNREMTFGQDYSPVIVSQNQLEKYPQKFSSNLDGNGLWIYWNNKKTGVPTNAVFGGYGLEGPVFLMLADHMDENGVYVGKIAGIYNAYGRKAFIEYQGKQYRKEVFDLLLHSSYKWADYDDNTTEMIKVGDEYGFCAIPGEGGLIWQAGRIDLKTNECITTYYNEIIVNKHGYKVLRRAC